MTRLVDADALKKALKSNCKPELCHDINTAWCERCCRTNDFEDLIDNAPTVTPDMAQALAYESGKSSERPKGKWKIKTFDEEAGIHRVIVIKKGRYFCTYCGKPKCQVYSDYCANCGADMREADDDL